MKIREGFVSNSSSASYIIKIPNITLDELYKTLIRECWPDFDKEYFIRELKKREETALKYIGDEHMSVYWKKSSEKYTEMKQRDEKEGLSSTDLAKMILEYNGITVNEESGCVEIHTMTTLHNSFVEGLHDIAKEILLIYLSLGFKVTLDVDHD